MPAPARPNFVLTARLMFWIVTAVMVLVMYKIPQRPAAAILTQRIDILYYTLLLISVADVAFIKFYHAIILQRTGGSKPDIRTISPRSGNAVVIFFAFAICPLIYAALYHFLGGSLAKTVSLGVFTIIGYALAETLMARQDSVSPGTDLDQPRGFE